MAGSPSIGNASRRQKFRNAQEEFSCLLLSDLVEEAIGTDQAVIIRGPVENVSYNELSDIVTVLFDQDIEVIEDGRL